MRECLLLLALIVSGCLLVDCGGGSSSLPPPAAITVQVSANSTSGLDANQSESLTATVSDDTNNQGVNWTVTCPAGVNACGAMAQSKTLSGVANQYAAPANVSSAETVSVTATSVSDPSKSRSIQVTVNPPLSVVNPPPLPPQSATAGQAFSLNLLGFVQGGTLPLTWSMTSGALPAGLSLNASTGMISGVPSTRASESVFTVTCTDSGNPPIPLPGGLEMSLTINAPASLTITSGQPPDGTVGSSYGGIHIKYGHSFTGFPLTATGGTPGYTWGWTAAQGSSLPPGLNIGLIYMSVGTTRCCLYVTGIGGTPTTAGTYHVVLTVTDSASPATHVSSNYTITIAVPIPLSITSPAPPGGTIGMSYGSSSTEDMKCYWNAYRGWHLACSPCSSPSACLSLPHCTGNVYKSPCQSTQTVFAGFPLSATGGVPPYTWGLGSSSSPPPGLKLSASGLLTGTPTTLGNYNMTVTVSDSALPPAQGSASYKIAIAPPPPPVINAVPLLPIGTEGSPYVGFTFTAASGAPPLTWAETGSLPQGMSFSTTGVLSGMPSVAGTFPLTVMVQDPFGQDAAPLVVTLQVMAQGFSPTGNMTTARDYHTATVLGGGKVLIAGGADDTSDLASAELFDPGSNSFAPTGGMKATRVSHTATLLSNGKVLLSGGYGGGTTFATAEIFDPTAGTFAPTGSMASARQWHTATLLNDGRVLVTGGIDGTGAPVATAEIFDPTSGLFTLTGGMANARFFHTATLLSNGKVLVAGGGSQTAELFDPTSEIFSPAGSMETVRYSASATALNDGKILVVGGYDDGGVALAKAEIFDPSAGTFAPAGDMVTARYLHTASLLSNGKVLVVGGLGNASTSVSAAELFDPATGTFSSTADMTAARASHTATALQNGQVLITGGFNENGVLASAELYQ
jgi:hypothetical protein